MSDDLIVLTPLLKIDEVLIKSAREGGIIL